MTYASPASPILSRADAAERPAPGTKGIRRRRQLWPYGYMGPAVVALLVVFAYSFVEVVHYSFYAGSVGALTYVGVSNYRELFIDPQFVHAMFNNFRLLFTVPIVTILALALAQTALRYHAGEGRLFHLPPDPGQRLSREHPRHAGGPRQPRRSHLPGLPQPAPHPRQERLGVTDVLPQRPGALRPVPPDRPQSRPAVY